MVAASFLPFDEAVSALKNDNVPFVTSETVHLHQAAQRIVAANIIAPFDVPSYDN